MPSASRSAPASSRRPGWRPRSRSAPPGPAATSRIRHAKGGAPSGRRWGGAASRGRQRRDARLRADAGQDRAVSLVRVGVVGLGLIGGSIARRLAELPDFYEPIGFDVKNEPRAGLELADSVDALARA